MVFVAMNEQSSQQGNAEIANVGKRYFQQKRIESQILLKIVAGIVYAKSRQFQDAKELETTATSAWTKERMLVKILKYCKQLVLIT